MYSKAFTQASYDEDVFQMTSILGKHPVITETIVRTTIIRNHIKTLQLLHIFGYSFSIDDCSFASQMGSFDCLKFIWYTLDEKETNLTNPEVKKVLKKGTMTSCIDCIRFMHETCCAPFTDVLCKQMINQSWLDTSIDKPYIDMVQHYDVFRYAYFRGAFMDTSPHQTYNVMDVIIVKEMNKYMYATCAILSRYQIGARRVQRAWRAYRNKKAALFIANIWLTHHYAFGHAGYKKARMLFNSFV